MFIGIIAVAKEFMYFCLSQAPSQYYGFYVLCAFRTFCNNWSLCTHTVLVVIVGPHTFESRIHKVAVELPNIIQGLVGVQLCTLFLLQICLTDGTLYSEYTSASGIVPTVQWYYSEIHFAL